MPVTNRNNAQFLAIRLAVFFTAFLYPLLFNKSFASDDTEWIAPTQSERKEYSVTGTAPWFGDVISAGNSAVGCIVQMTGENISYTGTYPDPAGRDSWVECRFTYISTGGQIYEPLHIVINTITDIQCDQLDYPNAEDLGLGNGIDHCHISLCDRNGEIFDSNGLSSSTGYVCVAQGNGEYCEHQLGNMMNPDGSVGVSVVAPTGESCGSSANDLNNPEWNPLTDGDSLPDPNDPNSPPSSDGDTECTPIDGTGLNVCNTTLEDACEGNTQTGFICPEGCGTVNGNFVCIVEDGGENADFQDPDNNNSGNFEADDPNTPGDEGTHSRLEGLLQNTDGIESLLRGIKDAIGDIPAGGSGEEPVDEGEEEEPSCPDGQFYIGETCITFDKNDQPIQSDLDFTQLDQLIADAEIEFSTVFNDIKTELESKFTTNLVGGAYTPNMATIYNQSVDLGMARLSGLFDFSIFGSLIMFAFGVRALFVLVGG